MAFTVQIIDDGPRNLVVHVQGTSPTAAGMLVDVSTLSTEPTTKALCRRVGLREVHYDVGADDLELNSSLVTLSWDATTDVVFLQMSSGSGQTRCWEAVGGIPNPMTAPGSTGDVVLDSTGALFNITLKFRKYYT